MPASAMCRARAVSERFLEICGSTAPRLSTVSTSMVRMSSEIKASGRATPRWSRIRALGWIMVAVSSRGRAVAQAHAVHHGHLRLARALLGRQSDRHGPDVGGSGGNRVVLVEVRIDQADDAGRHHHGRAVDPHLLALQLAGAE